MSEYIKIEKIRIPLSIVELIKIHTRIIEIDRINKARLMDPANHKNKGRSVGIRINSIHYRSIREAMDKRNLTWKFIKEMLDLPGSGYVRC